MPNTFPCPACGAPVEPAPNKTLMPCPFCGTSLTIPADLRWQQFTEPEAPPPTTSGKPAFDPFQAAENARFTGEKAEKNQAETEFVTDALRKAQLLAAGAVSAYALWASLRRFLPGCLIALAILCVLSCGVGATVVFFLRQGG
jgi:NADH pyrophosphatase NudC (nudix superfamily)